MQYVSFINIFTKNVNMTINSDFVAFCSTRSAVGQMPYIHLQMNYGKKCKLNFEHKRNVLGYYKVYMRCLVDVL
jgi:hypothetical protein